ncbi:Apoptotic chromatin condensation inducer in the nucleus [Schistosoma japonicum]|nr:Apoptotic chromatin condensation inducer in the nucleus [Schistosoma japonicum]
MTFVLLCIAFDIGPVMSTPEDVVLPDGRRIGDLKVADLRTQLEIRGLSRSGVKKDLCARLSGAVDGELRQERDSVELDDFSDGTINVRNEDTLEIDAVASDEEISEVSTSVNICEVNMETSKCESFCKSPSVSESQPDPPKNLEVSTEASNIKITESKQVLDQPISITNDTKLETEVQPIRRRQWGARSIPGTPSLSSESLEKLIPPSSCWVRSKSVVVENESDLIQPTSPGIYLQETVNHQVEVEGLNDKRKLSDGDVKDENQLDLNVESKLLDDKSNNHRIIEDREVELEVDAVVDKTKAVGYLVEPPERIEPMQPAKHPQTDIVYIRFLVRPFTAEQLRQMIVTHFGPVTDLWLDKIKSSSLIRLQTVEYATKCRDGLDGSRWPSMNPRVLRCEYASIDLFEWMKVNGDNNDLQPPKHLFLGSDMSLSNADTATAEAEKKDNDFMTSTEPDKKANDLRRKLERSYRDVEPVAVTKSRQGEVKDIPLAEVKPKSEEPAKLLNNLFRKTTATPSVYWLPLSPEQVERRIKKTVVKTSDAGNFLSHHSSHLSEEPIQKATRSPFTNASPSSCRNSNQSRRHPITTDLSSKSKISSEKVSSTAKSSDAVKNISAKKPVSNSASHDDKRPTSESKPMPIKDPKGGNRDIDDKKERLSKPDASSNSTSLKIHKQGDTSCKTESSPPTHTRKRRYSKTDSDDKEVVSSKQSRPNLTSSGDSSIIGDALAAYKKTHAGSQQSRSSEHRGRSSSGRHNSSNHQRSFKSSFPESSRTKDKTNPVSHSRVSSRGRRSRSTNQRHRSRSTERNRDRSSSNRYRSRR